MIDHSSLQLLQYLWSKEINVNDDEQDFLPILIIATYTNTTDKVEDIFKAIKTFSSSVLDEESSAADTDDLLNENSIPNSTSSNSLVNLTIDQTENFKRPEDVKSLETGTPVVDYGIFDSTLSSWRSTKLY
jgi:hypothetical protein